MADILPARTILTDQVSTKLWADPKDYVMHDGDVIEFRSGIASGGKK